MFKISDLSFDIKEAFLKAYIDHDGIIWNVALRGVSTNEAYPFEAKVSTDELLKTYAGELGEWKNLAGRTVRWDEPDDEDGVERGTLYVFRHESIYASEVHFYANNKGNLSLRWTGKCDLFWDDKHGGDLDLSIDVELAFQGIWFGSASEATCRREVARFFPQEQYDFTKTEHDASLLVPAAREEGETLHS